MKTRPLTLAIAATVALSLAGCAPNLTSSQPAGDTSKQSDQTSTTPSSHITHTDNEGSTTTKIDATASDAWVYFDFESKTEVKPTDPQTSKDWDIAFQRNKIKTNGGVSGIGGVSAEIVTGTAFEALTSAPNGTFLVDQDDSDDAGTDPDTVFLVADSWYVYNLADHTLTPRDQIYVLRTVEGRYVKIQFTGYYDAAGTAGHTAFRWAPIASPTLTQTVNAATSGQWTYLNLRRAEIVTPTEPASSSVWDLAFSRTLIQTNSGTSGAGQGGAIATPATTLAELTAVPEGAPTADSTQPASGAPGSTPYSGNSVLKDWYDYDETTHAVTPKNQLYVVRLAEGGFAKVKITSYASGTYGLEWVTAADGRTTF